LSDSPCQEAMARVRRIKRLALAAAALAAGVVYRRQARARRRRAVENGEVPARGSKKTRDPNKIPRGDCWKEIFAILRPANDPKAFKLFGSIFCCTLIFVQLDLRKATNQGLLFKTVFLGDRKKFYSVLSRNVAVEFTLACFNKILANIVSRLAGHWHEKLVHRLHERYFRNMNYYRLDDAMAHDRIANDTPNLSRQLAVASCDIINAGFQYLFYTVRLLNFRSDRITGLGPLFVAVPLGYMLLAMKIITSIQPNFAKLQKQERELEGKFRQSQTRVHANAEAIALYGGEDYEKEKLLTSFADLSTHINKGIWGSWTFEAVRDFVTKYGNHTVMMLLILGPFFKQGSQSGNSVQDNAQIMYEMRVVGDLVLHKFYSLGQIARLIQTVINLGGIVDRVGGLSLQMKRLEQKSKAHQQDDKAICEGSYISFNDVTIRTPTGNTLCEGLTFDIKQHDHLIICGPNGAGKSSIFRCLGTLWPIPKGSITRPGGSREGLNADVYYLPQKPYNALGTLKEQIVYPSTDVQHLNDKRMRQLLRMVELEYLLDIDAEATQNWEDKLSLGETQRLAMARLFWHKPKYAILDECTSAVSLKMEKRLFETCRRMGITLITISHRPALQEYHDRMLILNGDKGWEVSALDPSGSSDVPKTKMEREQSLSVIMTELEVQGSMADHTKAGASMVAVDKVTMSTGLYGRLLQLNKLMFQSSSEQLFSLTALAGLVVLRTALSNSIALLNGEAMRLLVLKDLPGFLRLSATALFQGCLQSMLSPTLAAVEKRMALMWRQRLNRHICDRYMQHQAYFHLKETMPDLKDLGSIDQVLASDVNSLTDGVANLWHEFVKPVVDIAWSARTMWNLTGQRGLNVQYAYMVGGFLFLRLVRPNLAQLTAVKEKLDADFAFVHARLRQHCESVAFFNGGKAEKAIVERHFDAKQKHYTVMKQKQHAYGVAQQWVGYFMPNNLVWYLSMVYQEMMIEKIGGDVNSLTPQQQGALSHDLRYLATTVNNSFTAFGAIMELYGKVQSLMGHVHRVGKVVEALDKAESLSKGQTSMEEHGSVEQEPGGNVVKFSHTYILTPNHTQKLAHDCSFELTRGQDKGILVTGQNGVGKSSVFRILAGLWPLHRGHALGPPPRTEVFFVPTVPYMAVGTLADQITYPRKLPQPLSDKDREHLFELLEMCRLTYLGKREGLDKFSDRWEQQLSLGEQQRLGVARAFFRKPRFVCLDECTSAVALDGEEHLYRCFEDLGCTVLTASQKPWLTAFHNKMLTLSGDGQGSWDFNYITPGKSASQPRLAKAAYVDKRQTQGQGSR